MGQFGYVVNGTTLALAKKGSGVPEKLNPCLAKFMQTKAYYDACVKYDLVDSCYPNEFFSTSAVKIHAYNQPTNEHSDGCDDGFCACTGDDLSLLSGASQHVLGGFLAFLLLKAIV